MTRLTDEQIKAATDARIQIALDQIQAAQNSLSRACQALSAVRGVNAQWNACGALHDKVQAFWWVIHNKRGSKNLRLDDLNIAEIERTEGPL